MRHTHIVVALDHHFDSNRCNCLVVVDGSHAIVVSITKQFVFNFTLDIHFVFHRAIDRNWSSLSLSKREKKDIRRRRP
jgi:hypothetical protein